PHYNATRCGNPDQKGELRMDLSTQELEKLKELLMATDEEFQTIANQHAEFKRRVSEIEANPHPSTEEIQEETKLKKLKLTLKDRMLEMMHQYRESLTV